MKITKSEKNRVYTINNIPAYDVYKKYLGEEIAKKLPAVGVEFPLIIDKDGESIARAVLSVHKDGSLSFAGNVNEGEIVYLGYGDGISIINESLKLKDKFAKKPIESIFIYSCMARRRFLDNLVEKEIKPLSEIAPTVGFFTYGEFFSFGKKELLNETMTILALSESDKVHKKINLKKEKIKLNEHQETLKAILHLLTVTVNELNKENKILQAKEESLKLAQEIGNFGSIEFNFNTRKIVYSDKVYEIFKIKEDFTTKKFMKRIIDKEKFKNVLRDLKDGKVKSTELKIKRNDGEIITVLLSAKMIFENNKPLKIVATLLDITEIYNLREENSIQSQILE